MAVFTLRISALPRRLAPIIGMLLGVAISATPSFAGQKAQARLVRCATGTCLRVSGHRQSVAVAIRVGGGELAVDGGRAWRATVPLALARTWPEASGEALILTLSNPQSGRETVQEVPLPPGALGRRVELASLVVRAR